MTYQAQKQKGMVVAMFALFVPIVIIFLSLVMNLGYMYLTKIELEFVTESAAHAGAVALHQGESEAVITSDAENYINNNPVVGQVLTSSEYTIEVGIWDDVNKTFTLDSVSPNSVRVETTTTRNYLIKGFLSLLDFTLEQSVIAFVSTTSSDYSVTIIEE